MRAGGQMRAEGGVAEFSDQVVDLVEGLVGEHADDWVAAAHPESVGRVVPGVIERQSPGRGTPVSVRSSSRGPSALPGPAWLLDGEEVP